MCTHEVATEQRQVVKPPVNCFPFQITYSVCQDCNRMFATTQQRRKNRKRYNQAHQKYHQSMMATHGIYY